MSNMAIGAILGGLLGQGVAGYLGNQAAQDQVDAANNQLKSIKALYEGIALPNMEDMRLDLQDYQSAGNLTPQQEAAEQLAMADALQNIQLDPRLKQAQLDQLATLQKIAGSGFTQDELLAAQALQDQNEAATTARLKQLQQQQDMRGVGTSDFALAQRAMEAQSGANRQAQDARALQAEAARRSLQAISQAGQLAGNLDQTDYARQAALAQNLNQRELTNLQQRANVNRSNVDRFNQALERNLSNQQNIMNQNVNLANQQQMANKGLYQQNFQNQLARAGGISGASGNLANASMQAAQGTRAMYGGIANAIGQGAAALTNLNKQSATNDNTLKTLPKWNPNTGRYE